MGTRLGSCTTTSCRSSSMLAICASTSAAMSISSRSVAAVPPKLTPASTTSVALASPSGARRLREAARILRPLKCEVVVRLTGGVAAGRWRRPQADHPPTKVETEEEEQPSGWTDRWLGGSEPLARLMDGQRRAARQRAPVVLPLPGAAVPLEGRPEPVALLP